MNKILLPCDICGEKYQHGPHIYQGHGLGPRYGKAFACPTCWNSNHDGWAPHLEPVLLRRLEQLGLPVPPRLPNGLLPRT